MGGDKQIQRAGDGSQQLQAQTINVYNGVTEERVRAIFAEQSILARKEYTEDAYRIADERVGKFEERFMPRITQVENALPSFADPAFQFLLRHAQQSAAATEREADYDLLTELLVCHIQKGEDRKNRTGINKAVEIVGEIDNDALCGLTVAHAFGLFIPITGHCIDGIRVLNDMFGKLMYQDLPSGEEWLDHLDILGAIRLSTFGTMKKVDQYYLSQLDGYICAGIKGDSEEHKKAVNLLKEAGINQGFLIKNECLDGYYRLAIRNKKQIEELGYTIGDTRVSLSEEQKESINQIVEMYSKEDALIAQAKGNFFEIWDSFEKLRKLRTWWDSIPHVFTITYVGRVLAQTNAKRCDPTLPDLL